jgi:hypothetical protein
MKLNRSIFVRAALLISLMASLTILSSKVQADTGNCGGVTITLPFNDVMASPFFCQIAAAYFSGLTNGTGDGTTYSPTQTVTREQMAAFISRTLNQSLKRGNRRAVAEKWWTPQTANDLTLTDVGNFPDQVKFDGTNLWVANNSSSTVTKVRPEDGKVLETWTGATACSAIVCAKGRVFITGLTSPGRIYMIDPTQPAGAVATLTSSLPAEPYGIAFDGSRLWTANDGDISITSFNPTTVTTVSTGFSFPHALVFDGTNMWVTDAVAHTLLKLNSDGSIAQTINVGNTPNYPTFDGTNIWVPSQVTNSVTVVRVKDASGNSLPSAFVLATLTGNGLNLPYSATFDGERILVVNTSGDSVSLWKAADLSPLGTFPTGNGTSPTHACSDGLNFWITLSNGNKLARF